MPTNDQIDRLIDAASGAVAADSRDQEQRSNIRYPFEGRVALVQKTPGGGKSIVTVVAAKDISSTGLCVRSRYLLHVGYEGAVLLRRSNGQQSIAGVRVIHSRYAGSMMHESGLAFTHETGGIALDDFRDDGGSLPELAPVAKPTKGVAA
jgi:hypothetical protein